MKRIVLKDRKENSYIMYGTFSEEEKEVNRKIHVLIQEVTEGLSFMKAANLLFPAKEN